ncbi:hypothetical protein SDC9_110164 [bioreactor metagenome]|uniref:Uncharacterized protein n=1 Tax=bioreactor metagenome TaxID=1076179 RepID=A0A645BNB5_9ZZZZ
MRYDNNTPGIIDFNGLGLFDGILICHYSDSRKEHLQQLEAEGRYRVYALTNDNSITVDDQLP